MTAEIRIPEIGESISEAVISKWLVAEGDRVQRDEHIVEIETDKVTVEIPSPESGVLGEIVVHEGETAKVGDVIARLSDGDSSAERQDASAKKQSEGSEDEEGEVDGETQQAQGEQAQGEQEQPRGAGAETGAETAEDSEDDQAAADTDDTRATEETEDGEAAEDVEETGETERAESEEESELARDVQGDGSARARSAAPPRRDAKKTPPGRDTAAPARAASRPERRERLSPLRRRIAQRLVQATQTSAMLTTFNEIDMSAVIDLRTRWQERFEQEHSVKLGFMSFFVRAAAEALRAYPRVNAMIDGDEIVYRDYIDIAIAVSMDEGLVTPVLRNVEQLGMADIERHIFDFAQRARSRELTLEELSGGTFTITNGGVFGSLLSTPILNPPQSGILGMHAILDRPVAINRAVVVRPMMYVALTYDHRLVDGRDAVLFLKRIREIIEEPGRMLLNV